MVGSAALGIGSAIATKHLVVECRPPIHTYIYTHPFRTKSTLLIDICSVHSIPSHHLSIQSFAKVHNCLIHGCLAAFHSVSKDEVLSCRVYHM
jgi:hypothetical protein